MALTGKNAESHQTKAQFFRQAGTLFGSGLTAERVLGILSADRSLRSLSDSVAQARMRVERGERISDIFETFSGVFDRHDIAVIRAAEASGDLASGFKELALYHERASKNAEKLRQVLTYPTLLMIVTVLVLGLMMIVVAPRFGALFQSQGIAPGPELSALLALSDWLVEYWWAPIMSLLVLTVALASEQGRSYLADRLLDMPFAGPLLEALEVERWSRALSSMVGRGVALPDALDTASGILQTPKLREVGGTLSNRVKDGRALSLAMAETGAFPESAIQLVRVGEESGSLADMLSHISTYHGEQAERRLTRALSLIEPAIILVLGGVVALIVLVLMSAVGDLNQLVL